MYDGLILGSSPYGPNAPKPYRQALCALIWCIHPPVGMTHIPSWLQSMLLTFLSLIFTYSNLRTVTCDPTVNSTAMKCSLFSRHVFFCDPIISFKQVFFKFVNFRVLFGVLRAFTCFDGTEMQKRKLLPPYNYNITLSLSKSKKKNTSAVHLRNVLEIFSNTHDSSLHSCAWLYQ
jgi:hypothetical protein